MQRAIRAAEERLAREERGEEEPPWSPLAVAEIERKTSVVSYGEELSALQRRCAVLMVKLYAIVFEQEGSGRALRPARMPEVEVELVAEAKWATAVYKQSPKDLAEMKRHVCRLLEDGVCQPSHSHVASPAIVVWQGGKSRMVVDFRKLNAVTKPDMYPMAVIDQLTGCMTGSALFTAADLKDGFYSRTLKKEQRGLFAFSTPFGLYELRRMAQGARNSPAVFQKGVNEALSAALFRFIVMYMDDATVFTKWDADQTGSDGSETAAARTWVDMMRRKTALARERSCYEPDAQAELEREVAELTAIVARGDRDRADASECGVGRTLVQAGLTEQEKERDLQDQEWGVFWRHLTHVGDFLATCWDKQMTLGAKKLKVARRSVATLGRVLSRSGVSVAPQSVQGIVNFPTPTSVKDVRAFLGLTGWNRAFCPRFAAVTAPLRDVLKLEFAAAGGAVVKGAQKKREHAAFQPWQWTADMQRSFEGTKREMERTLSLAYPDHTLPFVCKSDWSENGLGFYVFQLRPMAGTDLDVEVLRSLVYGPQPGCAPVEPTKALVEKYFKVEPLVFGSRSLNKLEKKYHPREGEALAIAWGYERERHLFLGKYSSVVTDHSSLQWLLGAEISKGRLARWQLKLRSYQLTIFYQSGAENVEADALSRYPDADEEVPDDGSDEEAVQLTKDGGVTQALCRELRGMVADLKRDWVPVARWKTVLPELARRAVAEHGQGVLEAMAGAEQEGSSVLPFFLKMARKAPVVVDAKGAENAEASAGEAAVALASLEPSIKDLLQVVSRREREVPLPKTAVFVSREVSELRSVKLATERGIGVVVLPEPACVAVQEVTRASDGKYLGLMRRGGADGRWAMAPAMRKAEGQLTFEILCKWSAATVEKTPVGARAQRIRPGGERRFDAKQGSTSGIVINAGPAEVQDEAGTLLQVGRYWMVSPQRTMRLRTTSEEDATVVCLYWRDDDAANREIWVLVDHADGSQGFFAGLVMQQHGHTVRVRWNEDGTEEELDLAEEVYDVVVDDEPPEDDGGPVHNDGWLDPEDTVEVRQELLADAAPVWRDLDADRRRCGDRLDALLRAQHEDPQLLEYIRFLDGTLGEIPREKNLELRCRTRWLYRCPASRCLLIVTTWPRDGAVQSAAPRYCAPRAWWDALIQAAHGSGGVTHHKASQTLERLSRMWWWWRADVHVARFVKSCEVCQSLMKAEAMGVVGTVTWTKPMLRVYLDCVTHLPKTERGNTAVMTCIDAFTGWWITAPIPTAEAKHVISAFVERVVCVEGWPRDVITDKGPEFVQVLPEVCREFDVEFGTTSTFRPSANKAERPHQDLNFGLRAWIAERGDDSWELAVALVTFNRNVRVGERGWSPFLLARGRDPTLGGEGHLTEEQLVDAESFGQQQAARVREAWEATARLDELVHVRSVAQNDARRPYGGTVPPVGSLVLYIDPQLGTELHHTNPSAPGLFEVTAVCSPQLVEIREVLDGRAIGDVKRVNCANLRRYIRPSAVLGEDRGVVAPRMLQLVRLMEDIVRRNGGEAGTGQVLKRVYFEQPQWQEYVRGRGGITMFLRHASRHTTLRVRTGPRGGASSLVLHAAAP